MNQNAWWKIALAATVVLFSVLYSLPNLYPEEPAIQISGASASIAVTDDVSRSAAQAMTAAAIRFRPAEHVQGSLLFRIADAESQVRAKDTVQQVLGENYVVALNLVPTTPAWLAAIGAEPMKLGLDLRGGVHFKLEVDMDKAIAQREEAWVDQFRLSLREKLPEGDRYKSVRRVADGSIEVRFATPQARAAGDAVLKETTGDFTGAPFEADGDFGLRLTLTEAALKTIRDYAIDQNRTTISNRVNELGVAEPLVQRQGANRIVVELPGVQDTATAKRVLGRTASLEFRLVDPDNSTPVGANATPPAGDELFSFKDGGRSYFLKREKIVTGDSVIGAQSGFDQQSSTPNVSISLDSKGGRAMQRTTGEHVGHPMAVLFVESKLVPRQVTNPDGTVSTVVDKTEERHLINVATIRGVFGSHFQITGLDSPAEAAELALLLRSGALAAPMYFVEERTVGPSLGKQNIESGFRAAAYGFALVVVFMLVNYRLVGLFGSVALVGNLLLLIAILGVINATLTLPGIAGIVLTMGMAVDANVLINERIKEELRGGAPVQLALSAGYERAWATILDSHITTLIVGVILFGFSTGSVKGFAITLSIGIVASLYTAVVMSRLLTNWKYGNKPAKSVSIFPIWERA